MKALGIDIGSSSIKGAVLDLSSSTVMTPVARPFPSPITGLPSGWVEIDPLAVVHAVDEVLSSLIEQAPDATWLGFSGQMGGLVLLDDRGKPLTNYISWQDQRSTEPNGDEKSLLDRIRNTWHDSGLFAELGNELQAGSTTTLMAWHREQSQIPRDAIPANIADFVIAHRVGHPIPMHATHAIGMLDLSHGDWHRRALEQSGLHDFKLPGLSHTESCVGEWKHPSQTLQVFGSYGDQQCALRGAGLQPNELSLNISTGSQVSRRTTSFQPGRYQSRKYFFGDTLDTVTHLPAGRSLNVLVDLLTEVAHAQGIVFEHPWNTINSLVEGVEDTDLEIDLAFFQGPLGNRGRIGNISTGNLSVGTLFLAAFRAMADNYLRIAERFSPMDWTGVVLSGGLTQKVPRLRSLLKDRFAVPLRESAGEETLAGLLDIARHTALRRFN
jgi:sugar (pentulose or hexulose) kinase